MPQAGVLIKNAEALEVLERVDALVVDKTGTLTEGKPRVVSVVSMAGQDEALWLRLAAGVEVASEHPLAAAIAAAARERGLEVKTAAVVSVSHRERCRRSKSTGGPWSSETRRCSRHWASPRRRLPNAPRPFDETAKLSCFVAIDGHSAGLLGIADPIKDSAAAAIDDLRKEGLRRHHADGR